MAGATPGRRAGSAEVAAGGEGVGGQIEGLRTRTRAELYDRAREIGIEGRSGMSKSQLIDALRHH